MTSSLACSNSDNGTSISTSKPSPLNGTSLNPSTTPMNTVQSSSINKCATVIYPESTESTVSAGTIHTPEPTTSITNTPGPAPLMFDTALKNTNWELISLNGIKPIEDTKITFSFVRNNYWEYYGSAGCNSYGRMLTKAIDGLFEYGQVGSVTLAGCLPEYLMEQEHAYLDILRTVVGYEVANDQLELKDEANETVLIYNKSKDV